MYKIAKSWIQPTSNMGINLQGSKINPLLNVGLKKEKDQLDMSKLLCTTK